MKRETLPALLVRAFYLLMFITALLFAIALVFDGDYQRATYFLVCGVLVLQVSER